VARDGCDEEERIAVSNDSMQEPGGGECEREARRGDEARVAASQSVPSGDRREGGGRGPGLVACRARGGERERTEQAHPGIGGHGGGAEERECRRGSFRDGGGAEVGRVRKHGSEGGADDRRTP